MDYLVIEGDFPFWRGFLVDEWKRLGHRTLLLSQAPALWRARDYDAVAPLPLAGDRLDVMALRSLAASFGRPAGALTVFEPAVGRTLEVQRALGLPQLSRKAPRPLRNKAAMVDTVAACGLAVPLTVSGTAAGSVVAAALLRLSFPMVVKPSELAGKAGVRRVLDRAELEAAVAAALQETLPFEIDGKPTSVVDLFGCEQGVLCQEYVEGKELSVEGYATRGEVVVLALTEKVTSGPPLFEELGHLQPASITSGEARDAEEYAVAVARAFALENCFFHLELRLAAGGPVLMEINCRLSGDMIGRLLELRSGMNLGRTLLALAGGEAVPPPGRWVGAAGVRMATVPAGGTIRALRAPVLRSDREMAVFELGPGSAVHPPKPGGVSRIGYYLAAADTTTEVERRLEELARETVVEM